MSGIPVGTPREIPGLILAGGLARRMGGGDKGARLVGSEPILARVIERLAPQCAGLALNANGDPARFAEWGLPVIPDAAPDHPGPLAGVLAGLDDLAGRAPSATHLLTASVDCPFLPRDLVSKLEAARVEAGTPLAVAASGGQAHPVIGLWAVALRDDLRRALLEESLRKIDRWTARHGVAVAEWSLEPYDPFFNANAPEDLAEAERVLARWPEA